MSVNLGPDFCQCKQHRIKDRPSQIINHSHTHTTVLLLRWNLSGTTRVSRYQKGKTRKVKNQSGFTGARDSEWQWHLLGRYKSASHPRQPRQHPTTQFFTGRMPFLPPNQQHQKCPRRKQAVINSSTLCAHIHTS